MATVLKSKQIQFGDNTCTAEVFNWEDVAAKAKAYLATIRQQAEELIRDANEQSIAIRQKAEQSGRELGQGDVAKQAERLGAKIANDKIASASESLRSLAEELEEATQVWLRQWQHETIPLAVAIAERLVHRQIELDPSILLEWLHNSVKLIQSQQKIELRMNASDIDTLGDALTGFIGDQKNRVEIELVRDNQIEKHGAVLRGSEVFIDQQLKTQLARLQEELV